MSRNADSAAGQELTAQLSARGLVGSSARYERWRRAGVLPRHKRRGASRGRGSTSTLAPATVEIAATLARHAVQGRDLRTVVIAWFVEAGYPATVGERPVPEPPDTTVIEALAWTVRANPAYRLLRRARAAATEAEQDAFYADADVKVRREGGAAVAFDPLAVRAALLGGEEIPDSSGKARTELV